MCIFILPFFKCDDIEVVRVIYQRHISVLYFLAYYMYYSYDGDHLYFVSVVHVLETVKTLLSSLIL